MNNTVYDIDFTRALPTSLKEDETINTLGRVIAAELQKNIELSRLNIIYPRIDELPEHLLDVLAYDLHIDWYDPDAPAAVKRDIIKQSVKIHKRMGTKYAVESVVKTYFGSGEVREWHEYGGEPHHFKILTDNPSVTDENAEQFFRILDIVKRKSSWLETILITLTGESTLTMGVAYKEFTRESHLIGASGDLDQYLRLYIAGVFVEHTAESHIMGSDSGLNVFVSSLFRDSASERTLIGDEGISTNHAIMLHERTNEQHTFKEE